jgi:hypothetical protein
VSFATTARARPTGFAPNANFTMSPAPASSARGNIVEISAVMSTNPSGGPPSSVATKAVATFRAIAFA